MEKIPVFRGKKLRKLIAEGFKKIFKEVDCLVAPTAPTVAFNLGEKLDDPLTMYLSDILTAPANIGGITAISVPCGFSKNLPVGLQIIGNSFDEENVFKISYNYDKATVWSNNKPRI